MAVVFVHGVPDTFRVWDKVVSRLDRKDVVTLSLPGFDSPVPDGFDASKEAYVNWLRAELNTQSGPLDLVGHDWGALLVMRCVALEPGLARSWAAGAAPIDSAYVWHEAAQMWQTAGVGEQFMAALTPEATEAALAAGGVPAEDAAVTATHIDATMKECILKLYRSAVRVGAEWEGDLGRISAPGLVLWGEKDPYVTPDFGARLAERTGARLVSLPCSHWWQLERPDEVAAEMQRFWAGCP